MSPDTPNRTTQCTRPTARMTLLAALLALTACTAGPALAQNAQDDSAAQPAARDNDAAQAEAESLPLQRAVMFSSGVGYFEHVGNIEGDTNVRLMFQKEQINDVLKSMVVMDAGGGAVSRASYPTKDPIERTLASFAVDLSNKPTLPELLDQLRGSTITVHSPNAITGRIVSVEQRERVVGDPPTKVIEHLLTLATDDGLRNVRLGDVSRVQLDDAQLQDELNKALTTLAGARDMQRRPVTLRFEGEGERQVRIGYLIETPVWKTSYRLDLSQLGDDADAGTQMQADGGAEGEGADGEGEDAGDKAMLQGWAMVENMTESDWQDIELSLVSGQPISYTMDLYTPLYVDRPDVKIPRYAALRPRMHEEGMAARGEADDLLQEGAARSGRAGAREYSYSQMGRQNAPGAAADPLSLSDRGVQAQVQAGDVGELFRFTLDQAVTLDRRRSAMLPIVTEQVDAEKVSIYNQQQDATHPMSGIELTNSTDLKLLAGPVTVLDGGMYAGDALIDHMTPGETRLLSYAVDLSVTVDPSVRSDSAIVGAKIVRGVLHISRRHEYTQTYRINNKADEQRTLIVEHPFHSSRNLIEPAEPDEKTPNLYRFRVPVEADTTGEFTVREEQTRSQTIALLDRPVGEFLVYTRRGEIDDDVQQALQKAAQLKNELSQLQRDMRQKQQELNEITSGQDRLRRNIEAVQRDSELGQRYIRMLSEQEDQIETLQGEIAELRDQVAAKEKELADYLQELNVE